MSAMMQGRVIDHLDEDRDLRSDGLTLRQLEQFTMQVRDQPDWRSLADKCCDYYDNNQLDPDTLATLTERGMGPLTRNLIASTVNLVLGIEAQNKRDWRVEADTDDELETAEGLSSLLHESERETRADRAVSDAFASMVKCGLGWVEVGKNWDLDAGDCAMTDLWRPAGADKQILLYHSNTFVQAAGDNTEQVLAYTLIPAGTLTANSTIEIGVIGVPNASTFLQRVRIGTTHTTADAGWLIGPTWGTSTHRQECTIRLSSATGAGVYYADGVSIPVGIPDVAANDLYLSFTSQRASGSGAFTLETWAAMLRKPT